MKALILVALTVTISFNVMADDSQITCPSSGDAIVAMITAKDVSCYDAKRIAETCAFGSSMDNLIAGSARNVCLTEAGKLSKADIALLATLDKRCNEAYANQQGTMYQSMNAFCHLDAANFIRSVQEEK
jgi:hypothetical protein